MILTGNQILKEMKRNNVFIEPFDINFIEPNSYKFHLGTEIIEYEQSPFLDIKTELKYRKLIIPEEGFLLEKGKFYLGATYERMGSPLYAQTLHANFSTSSMGMWIQFSAPLGHVGAVINWTLEITVTENLIVYPKMPIGKIAFWKNMGKIKLYKGRYLNSNKVIASRINKDF